MKGVNSKIVAMYVVMVVLGTVLLFRHDDFGSGSFLFYLLIITMAALILFFRDRIKSANLREGTIELVQGAVTDIKSYMLDIFTLQLSTIASAQPIALARNSGISSLFPTFTRTIEMLRKYGLIDQSKAEIRPAAKKIMHLQIQHITAYAATATGQDPDDPVQMEAEFAKAERERDFGKAAGILYVDEEVAAERYDDAKEAYLAAKEIYQECLQ